MENYETERLVYSVNCFTTIFFFIAGIFYLVRMHIGAFHVMGYGLLLNGIISSAGIISFTRKNYKAAQTLFTISEYSEFHQVFY